MLDTGAVLFGVAIKTLFVFTAAVGLLAPLVAWMERKQGALAQGRTGPARADLAGLTLAGALHPVAGLAKLLAKETIGPTSSGSALHRVAPWLALVPALTAFAVIPYGGVYTFQGTRIALVAADVDWGLLTVVALGGIALFGPLLAGLAGESPTALLGAVRSAGLALSTRVVMLLALVPMLMIYGGVRLLEIGAAQDHTVWLGPWVERLGAGGWTGAVDLLAWVGWPAWGVVLQPISFALFMGCALAEARVVPFDAGLARNELGGGILADYSGARLALFQLAGFFSLAASAALATVLFFGGWTLPYLSQQRFVEGLAPWYGHEVATALCLALHVGCFFAKVAFVVWLLLLLRWSLPRFRHDRAMARCWKTLVPLAIANVAITAVVLLSLDAG